MKETGQKMGHKNGFLGVVAGICVLGIVLIAVILVLPLAKRSSLSLDNSEYQYTLTAGFYEVGAHLPAGTYKITVVNGEEGYFSLHESPDLYFNPLNVYRVVEDKESDNVKIEKADASYTLGMNGMFRVFKAKVKVKDVTLKEGQFVNVKADTKLIFYSNEIEDEELAFIHIDNTETYYVSEHEYHFIESNAIAGVDFPTGVYDILYKPVQETNSGTIQCNMYFNEVEKSILFECDGEDGEQIVFRGVPFTPNSSITTNYLDEIILVPTEYIGKAFNDITRNAQ